jgi:hypothetical protein
MTNGGDQLGTTWIEPEFVAGNDWRSVSASIGYQEPLSNFEGHFGSDIPDMLNTASSAYLRIPFHLTDDPTLLDRLKLRMKFDDGFVAYLNGVPIVEENAPETPAYDSSATRAQRNSDAIEFKEYDLTSAVSLLKPGANVLAFHGLNRQATSNDFLLTPQLIGERFPEVEVKQVTVETPSIELTGRGWIDVHRIRVAGQSEPLPVEWTETMVWKTEVPLQPGMNEIELEAVNLSGNVVGTARIDVTSQMARPLLDHLRISEIMYHATDPTASELAAGHDNDDAFDFLEFVNTSPTETLSLAGVRVEDGIDFEFPARELLPLERIVIVDNPDAFTMRYGTANVAGRYARSLSNGGETIRVLDPVGTMILQVTYDDSDPWPTSADGDGFALELIDVNNTPVNQLSSAAVWQASRPSPGTANGSVAGDLNGDRVVNAADIDLLCAAILADETVFDARFDLNRDGQLTSNDHLFLIDQILGTSLGDANLDGIFNSRDFVLVFQAGEYEDSTPGNSTWGEGDWNCDGEFNSRDLVTAFQFGKWQV